MFRNFCKNVWTLATLILSAIALSGPTRAQVAAGFDQNASSGLISGFAWTVNTGAVAHCANGSGGSNTAMFGVSANGQVLVGVADDSSGLFHGAAWNGVNAASTTPAGGFFDSGTAQGFPGNDTPWSINNTGNAVGQGVGQISGYDTGFFAGIEWTGNGSAIVDLNSLNDPAGNAMSGSSYYGGPVYIEGYDITGGLVGSAAGINTSGQISATSFQNFGSFYYQGIVAGGGGADDLTANMGGQNYATVPAGGKTIHLVLKELISNHTYKVVIKHKDGKTDTVNITTGNDSGYDDDITIKNPVNSGDKIEIQDPSNKNGVVASGTFE